MTIRLLRGYIELLGGHVTTLLHSDVHLRRLSSALCHVLQFDCSLIQIIEERTAGEWSLPTPTKVTWVVFSPLIVCLFSQTIPQKLMQLGSPDLT